MSFTWMPDEPPKVSSSSFVYTVRSSCAFSITETRTMLLKQKSDFPLHLFKFFQKLPIFFKVKRKAPHRDWPHPLLVPCFLIVLLYAPALLECTLCSLSYTPECFSINVIVTLKPTLAFYKLMNANHGPQVMRKNRVYFRNNIQLENTTG